ncbi:MAG: sialidase family protein [Thermaurantimonas sp.]|uniref:sialidase family protein n=1 Tax=Thermaurantimonas sp. TaxID=2681568 RepID=UPI00391B7796
MKKFYVQILALSAIYSIAQPRNVLINTDYQSKLGTCEPSVAISRKDPNKMVIGTVLDGVYYSHDGGRTWKGKQLKSLYGVWGDPVLVADYRGDFHYFHLSDPTGMNWKSDEILDRIVVQSSSDGGINWTVGSFAGFNPPKKQDKPWAVAHPTFNSLHLTWTQFDKYYSRDTAHKSYIMYARSTDGGNHWTPAIKISTKPGDCLDSSATAEGAVPAVLADSSVFVVWSRNDSLWINFSLDEGNTWLAQEKFLFPHRGGWSMRVTGLNRANGMPYLMADASKSRFRNSLYLTWIDWDPLTGDYFVMFSKSLNKNGTWTTPRALSRGSSTLARFAVTGCVDQSNGNIYILYYEQAKANVEEYNVVLHWSKDGGNSWSRQKINQKPVKVTDEKFFGDYNHIDAWKGVIRPVWTSFDGITTNVYTALVTQSILDLNKIFFFIY